MQGLAASEVYPILEDRAGTIWIGSLGDGLFRFQNGVFSQLPGSASAGAYTSLFEDRGGRVWANGRQRFVDGHLARDFMEEAWPPEMGACWTMYEDPEGAFWFGTERGVVRYQDGVQTRFTTKDGLAGDDTKVIIGDGAGGLWLGSYGGLTHFRDGRFTAWTESAGLPGNTVRALSSTLSITLRASLPFLMSSAHCHTPGREVVSRCCTPNIGRVNSETTDWMVAYLALS